MIAVPARSAITPAGRPKNGLQVTQSLLGRMADGDQAAVGECITRYGGLVWSLARRLLRDHAEAEDGVQEAFVAVWQAAGQFDPTVAKESTFVGMIARRRLIDRRRRLDRLPTPVTLEQGRSVSDLKSPTVDGVLQSQEESDRLAHLWTMLRDEERAVLQLAIYEGCTYAEIAERSGTPLGTVKSRARSGLSRLREGMRRISARAEEESE